MINSLPFNDPSTDAALVEKFRAGDRRAFDRLVQRWQDPVYRVAWRYTGSADEAMDVTQNTFVKAWTRIDSLDEPTRFGAWIYRIARHQCLDHLKTAHRQRFVAISSLGPQGDDATVQEDIPDDSAQSSPQHTMEQRQTSDILNQALDRIPEEQKMIIILKEYEGLKFREIADILDLPENTVKSRLYYGLNALRKLFSQNDLAKEVYQP